MQSMFLCLFLKSTKVQDMQVSRLYVGNVQKIPLYEMQSLYFINKQYVSGAQQCIFINRCSVLLYPYAVVTGLNFCIV
ncbi:hypothetical protein XELAEV_18047219mg [Xenopus laevis]|uniref:Uncharacterized protein n=1 Tax=Xenopus laevis TaxID=8355 RepID=A0A974BUR7_XENLA|nr:hypothetical protein XELAEV_18047219mg [Xenopus laevis]